MSILEVWLPRTTVRPRSSRSTPLGTCVSTNSSRSTNVRTARSTRPTCPLVRMNAVASAMRRSRRAGPCRPRPQTPRYACQFGRLASTSSVGAWTPCVASSVAVDTWAWVRRPPNTVCGGRAARPQGGYGCASLAELQEGNGDMGGCCGFEGGNGPEGIAVAGVTVPYGRSSRAVSRQLSSRCAVVRMVATAGPSGAGARCRTMPVFGRRGRRQAGRPAATRHRWRTTGNGRQQLGGVASRP